MNWRHRIIKLLACGDAMIVGVEFMRNGAMRPKDLGGMAMLGCDVSVAEQSFGIEITENADRLHRARLTFETEKNFFASNVNITGGFRK